MTLKLKPHNHREDSQDWEEKTNDEGQTYKVNPEWDIWEYNGEQYFTFDAVQRLGLRVPTKEEFTELSEAQDLRETLPLNGYRNYADGVFNSQSSYGCYWTASPLGSYGYSLSLSSSQVDPVVNSTRSYGFSVRCLEELASDSSDSSESSDSCKIISEPFLAVNYNGKTYKLTEI